MDYNKRYTTGEYFEKRLIKTVIPYLAWTIIGIVYNLVLGRSTFSDINLHYLWDGIISSKIVPIYWFFPSLFGIYLTLPVLAAVNECQRKFVFKYLITVGFATINLAPLVTKILNIAWNAGIALQLGGYLIYAIFGYYIKEYGVSQKIRIGIYIAGIVGLITHIVGTYYFSMAAGEIDQTFKGYINAPCVAYSAALFIFFRYNISKITRFNFFRKAFSFISPYTFGIYLLQFFVFTTMTIAFNINVYSIVYRLGAPFVIIPLCIGACWIIRKIPLIRIIVP